MQRVLADSKSNRLQGKAWVNSIESDYMAYMSHLIWTYAGCMLILLFLKFIFADFPVFV